MGTCTYCKREIIENEGWFIHPTLGRFCSFECVLGKYFELSPEEQHEIEGTLFSATILV